MISNNEKARIAAGFSHLSQKSYLDKEVEEVEEMNRTSCSYKHKTNATVTQATSFNDKSVGSFFPFTPHAPTGHKDK